MEEKIRQTIELCSARGKNWWEHLSADSYGLGCRVCSTKNMRRYWVRKESGVFCTNCLYVYIDTLTRPT